MDAGNFSGADSFGIGKHQSKVKKVTKLLFIAKTLVSAVRMRFDSYDLMLGMGATLCACGIACYSIPLALIAIGSLLIGIAIYGAAA